MVVLFGTDYPAGQRAHENLTRSLEIVGVLDDLEVRNKVLGGNAAGLFGIQ